MTNTFLFHSYPRIATKHKLTSFKILDRDPALHFALLRLQLVELIRDSGWKETGWELRVIHFAKENLAPRAAANPDFLEDLEQTMALAVFPHDNLDRNLAAILDLDLRRKVADDVNMAILQHQAERRDAAIRELVRMRAWAENKARHTTKSLPEVLELGLSTEDGPLAENGVDAMITS